jgi:hypothetical protein
VVKRRTALLPWCEEDLMALLLGDYVREVDAMSITAEESSVPEEQCIVAQKLASATLAMEVAMESVKDTILLEIGKRP